MSPSISNHNLAPAGPRVPAWLLLVVFLLIVGSHSFLTKSLWLDEAGSFWVVQDGLSETISRAIAFQGQSPLYYVILWGATQLLGVTELALRVPSIIFLFIASVFLFRIAERFVGRDGAFLSVMFFLSGGPILVALSARPYALALAATLASFEALFRWRRGGRVFDLLLFVAWCVLIFYSHYLFAGAFLVHILIMRFDSPSHPSASFKRFLIAIFAAAILAIPGLFQLASIMGRRESLSYVPLPTLKALLLTLIPVSTAVALIGGLLIIKVIASGAKISLRTELSPSHRKMLLLWFLAPPIIFFVGSYLLPSSLYNDRYFLWHLPALAIFAAAIVKAVGPERVRAVLTLVVVFFLVLAENSRKFVVEDWKGAYKIAEENPKAAVLLSSGLVEARQVEWLTDPVKRSYLASSAGYYLPGRSVTLLPDIADSANAERALRSSLSEATTSGPAILISLMPRKHSVEAALNSWLSNSGHTLKIIRDGKVRVEALELGSR